MDDDVDALLEIYNRIIDFIPQLFSAREEEGEDGEPVVSGYTPDMISRVTGWAESALSEKNLFESVTSMWIEHEEEVIAMNLAFKAAILDADFARAGALFADYA